MLRTTSHICWKLYQLSTRSASRKARLYRNKYTIRENPGVHRRLKLIAEDEPDIDKANIDHLSIEELNQDFMQASELNDEILSNMREISRIQKFKITEKKYFKPPKEPNMLTWTEKEQIIRLHQQDPEKWSPEALAESFPASPTIISKILKAKWKPFTKERLKAHDQSVSENWIAFHKGDLTVHDPKLRAHLAKFTDRKDGVQIISDEEAARITEINIPRPSKTEFLSLVKCARFKSENESTETENAKLETNIQPPKQIGDVQLNNVIDRSGVYYTLDQYRDRLSTQLEKCSEDREEIKAIVNSGRKNTSVETAFENYVAPSESFKPDAIVIQRTKKSRLLLRDKNSDPNKIIIPKEKWKPGLVYRVNDCFYNDQGTFLYRVPGLKAE